MRCTLGMRNAAFALLSIFSLLPSSLWAEDASQVVTRVEARAVIVRREPADLPPPAVDAQARLVIADRVVARQDGPAATIAYY